MTASTTAPSPVFACHVCAGEWAENYTFDRAPGCRIDEADAVTVRADIDRLELDGYAPFNRDATEIELEIRAEAFNLPFVDVASYQHPSEPAERVPFPQTLVFVFDGSHCREVAGFDPIMVAGYRSTSTSITNP